MCVVGFVGKGGQWSFARVCVIRCVCGAERFGRGERGRKSRVFGSGRFKKEIQGPAADADVRWGEGAREALLLSIHPPGLH